MNDIRRTILWVIFGFSMVLLWDKWQIHNGKQATFFPTPVTATAPAENKPAERLRNAYASVHIVKKGDTLYHLAKRYGTTVNKIKRWNNSDENLSIGQKLLVSRS